MEGSVHAEDGDGEPLIICRSLILCRLLAAVPYDRALTVTHGVRAAACVCPTPSGFGWQGGRSLGAGGVVDVDFESIECV